MEEMYKSDGKYYEIRMNGNGGGYFCNIVRSSLKGCFRILWMLNNNFNNNRRDVYYDSWCVSVTVEV